MKCAGNIRRRFARPAPPAALVTRGWAAAPDWMLAVADLALQAAGWNHRYQSGVVPEVALSERCERCERGDGRDGRARLQRVPS